MNFLVFLIVIIPFQFYFDVYKHYTSSLAQVIAVALILFTFFKYKKIKEFIFSDSFSKAVILFIGILLLSSLNAINFKIAFIHILKWGVFIMVYFPVVLFVDSKEKFKRLVLLLLVPAIILCILGIWQYTFTGKDMLKLIEENKSIISIIMEPSSLSYKVENHAFNWYRSEIGIRVFGAFLSTNNFSQYIGLVLPLMFGLFLSAKNKLFRVFMVVIISLLVIMNILTFSRGGWLGILGMALCGILFITKRKNWKFLWKFIGAFLILFSLLISVKSVRVKTYNRFSGVRDSMITRGNLWAGAIDIISEKPLLGTGPGNYDLTLNREKYEGPAHSNYLHIGAEFGLLGLAVFIYIILMGFRNSYFIYSGTDRFFKCFGIAFFMLWVWFSLQSIFTDYLFGIKYGMMFWTVAGLNSALLRIKKNNDQSRANN